MITHVGEGPKLEALLDDPVWSRARPVYIHTQQGANLGGTGKSLVEVRAVHDGEKVYFAFRWEDPTRSLRRIPIIKREDGWHVLDNSHEPAGCRGLLRGQACRHLLRQSVAWWRRRDLARTSSSPRRQAPPLNERGFHYTTDGSYMDMWQWKASRGGMLGRVDSQYFGPPYEPSKDEANYDARYQGGYWNKPGHSLYSYNFKFIRKDKDPNGPATIIRLPKDWRAQVAALGKYDLDPNSNDDENGRWYMFEQESEPYTPEADAQIPVGTVLPGVIISGDNDGERADVVGRAKWKDGHWTLITARNLKIGSKYGKNFVARTGSLHVGRGIRSYPNAAHRPFASGSRRHAGMISSWRKSSCA